MKKWRRGLLADIISEYLTPLNMLLFLTFFMTILVMAWFINVWWTMEQQRLAVLRSVQAQVVSP
ncbi:hypothetical protein [Ignicoccus hospitalis]|uniref:hypothetical protein n=1 Tax=Ignicoccus hospitalis TaxID=160233 RepID=UPI000324EC2B|nr:hypothetical protein [Ignicoccus hospitalis]HIH90352.1 hypothetical protein [Desulfurococcaceae archaeon]